MSHAPPTPPSRATVHLPPEAADAFRDQAAATPDGAPWLRLLEAVLRAADEPAWREADIRFAAGRPADAPLLEGARLLVDARAADALAAALLDGSGAHTRALDPIALLAAGLDPTGADRAAAQTGLPPDAAATVAQLMSRPILLEAARRAAPAVPPDWQNGYCPLCGDWPAVVEQRGLERRRVLRCGRCATGWHRPVLRCPFCDERDHRRQGSLVPDEGGELVRVETCDSCLGYLRSTTTLRARPPWALWLDDLRTLPLELAALDRGFRRPERAAWTLEVGVSPRGGTP